MSDLFTADNHFPPPPGVRLTVATGTDLDGPVHEVDVALAVVHPKFDPRSLVYDAALLRLADDIDGAIPLTTTDLVPGDCGVVGGWEESRGAGSQRRSLTWTRMHVAHNSRQARLSGGDVVCDSATMFVAGGPDAACPEFQSARLRKGDSGSGFVVTRDSAPRLAGIVSWSASACPDGVAPCVFTRIFPLAQWITREMNRAEAS